MPRPSLRERGDVGGGQCDEHGGSAAQAVAHDLRVTLSALAGSATVAVVAGDTQASPQASE